MGGEAIKAALGWARDWLYPPACPACGAAVGAGDGLCAACFQQATLLDGPVCPRCGAYARHGAPEAAERWRDALAAPGAPRCPECPPGNVAFTAARAAMAYQGPAPRLVRALKYGDRLEAAPLMGRLMARIGAPLLRAAPSLGAPLLAPAPLHWTRRLRRGSDQAALLARAVARALAEAPTAPAAALAQGALKRRRATAPQTSLDRDARWENVEGAFEVASDWRGAVQGRRVVLVDDVMTTGATLDACAAALRRAGAARVDALVFARPSRAARIFEGDAVAWARARAISASEDLAGVQAEAAELGWDGLPIEPPPRVDEDDWDGLARGASAVRAPRKA